MVRESRSSSLSLDEDFPKYRNGDTNGRCYLILMLQNKPKKLFSHAKNPNNHSDIYFNNMPLKSKNTQKHLGLYLDAKFNISEHINEKSKKSGQRY